MLSNVKSHCENWRGSSVVKSACCPPRGLITRTQVWQLTMAAALAQGVRGGYSSSLQAFMDASTYVHIPTQTHGLKIRQISKRKADVEGAGLWGGNGRR